MGNDDDDDSGCWTTVPTARSGNSSGSGKRGRRSRRRPAPSSFYSQTTAAASASNGINSSGELLIGPTTGEGEEYAETIRRAVEVCMEALDRHDYVVNLLAALRQAPAATTRQDAVCRGSDNTVEATAESSISPDIDNHDNDGESAKEGILLRYGEIVCYGIGNFAPTSSFASSSSSRQRHHVSYSVPMLQLALALLIRRSLARDESPCDAAKNEWSDTDYGTQHNIVKMVYFEPLMTELERYVLEHVFHVDILNTNERGKRTVVSSTSDGSSNSKSGRRSTLFYMPHCPMRLYGNVLWSNWSPDVLCDGNIVIYGNDFHGYDDRVLSSEERSDETNAVLRIIPHLISRRIDGLTNNRKGDVGGKIDCDALAKLENAFNDSVVMTFVTTTGFGGSGEEIDWPERPREYIFDEKGERGSEVL